MRDVREKRGFCKNIGYKRKFRENMDMLLNEAWVLVMKIMEKVEVVSASTIKTNLQECQVPEIRSKGWSKEEVPTLGGRAPDQEMHKQTRHT